SPPDWQVAAAAPSEGTRTVPISTARASPRDSHLTSDPSGRLGVTPLFVEATDLLPQSTPTPAVWHDDDRPLVWRSDEVSNRIRQSGHSGLLERSHPVRIDFRSSRRPNLPPPTPTSPSRTRPHPTGVSESRGRSDDEHA